MKDPTWKKSLGLKSMEIQTNTLSVELRGFTLIERPGTWAACTCCSLMVFDDEKYSLHADGFYG